MKPEILRRHGEHAFLTWFVFLSFSRCLRWCWTLTSVTVSLKHKWKNKTHGTKRTFLRGPTNSECSWCYVEFLLKHRRRCPLTCVDLRGPNDGNGGILVWARRLCSASHLRLDYSGPVAGLCCRHRPASSCFYRADAKTRSSHDVFIAWWIAAVGNVLSLSILPFFLPSLFIDYYKMSWWSGFKIRNLMSLL